MNYAQAQEIQDTLYQIRDGIYIGKYDLQQVKPKLQAVIEELYSGNDQGQKLATRLQREVLPNTALRDTDANETIFWRSMNDVLYSIDLWVVDYATVDDTDPR